MKNILFIHLSKNFSFSGQPLSINGPFSNDVLIYKIGDYADYTEVDKFVNENETSNPTYTETPTPSADSNLKDNGNSSKNTIIIATLSSVLGTVILGFAGFIIFKRCKKSR